MDYLNDLTQGCWCHQTRDGEYLRERLAEGHSFDACCQVVEAAVASGMQHPRRVFVRDRFSDLLAARTDPHRWAALSPHFDAVLDRYAEANPPTGPEAAPPKLEIVRDE